MYDGRPRIAHYFPAPVSFPLTVQMVIAFNGLREEHQEMRTHIAILQVGMGKGGPRSEALRAIKAGFARIADAWKEGR